MTNCKRCNCSPFEKTLHRTEPIGSDDAGWMCIDCIKEDHSELAKNILGDNNDVLNIVEEVCGVKKTQ